MFTVYLSCSIEVEFFDSDDNEFVMATTHGTSETYDNVDYTFVKQLSDSWAYSPCDYYIEVKTTPP